MALLLAIKRLDSTVDLFHSSDVDISNFSNNEPVSYHNSAFEKEGTEERASSPCPTISILLETEDNLNNNRPSIRTKSDLTSADSAILTSNSTKNGSSEDTSSLGEKSLDSGVYDVKKNPHLFPGDIEWGSTGGDVGPPKKETPSPEETLFSICIQVFIPFLIAGIGTCGAGIVLDHVEKWEVFQNITPLFVLVPTLLGLKGNLEMTLASRVSTQANLGRMDKNKEKWQMFWGNMALIQCQATVMGMVAASFATGTSLVKGNFNIQDAFLLCASALFTAAVASLVLGAITLAVVVISHKCYINPDNVATPIAASLGDVTTLAILAAISNYLFQFKNALVHSSVIVGVFLLLVPLWAYISYKNPYVKKVLYTGWVPVILAVVITSLGGYILEYSVQQFKGIAIFQPVINGVAGNLVAVQASRISTYFHQNAKPGGRPPDGSSICISPFAAFFGKSTHARTARILMGMVIPGHLLFGYAITFIKGGDTVLTPKFVPIYLASAFVQIALLLYIAHCMINLLWLWKVDPDNWAIPLMTALGDLSGTGCLTAAFFIRYYLGIGP